MVVLQETERQYWLWVTKPEYYLDDNWNEREDLEPGYIDLDGWWTCHKNTRKGDLIFLYRTTLKNRTAKNNDRKSLGLPKLNKDIGKDIKYLIRAESDAYPIWDDNYASKKGWDYGCNYSVLDKIEPSLSFKALKENSKLLNWYPVKRQFQGSVFKIDPEYWNEIKGLIDSLQSQAYKPTVKPEPVESDRPIPSGKQLENIVIDLEKQLEDALIDNLGLLKPFDYHLELYKHPKTGMPGRQFFCRGLNGYIDLLCWDTKHQQYVVIELKNVKANRDAFGQICSYVGWAEEKVASGTTPVIGLVISRGYDTKFESAMKITNQIFHINLQQLGFQ